MAGFFSTLFGGGSEREAANANRAALGTYQNNAFAAMDSGLGRSTGAVTDAANQAGGFFGQNYDLYGGLRGTGYNILDNGRTDQINALNGASAAYDPLASLGTKYGEASSLLLDSLGVNGADGNARATSAFQAGPGYEFTLGQGLDAINRRRAASGMLGSGNADIDAITYGTGLANQTYTNWQNQLGAFTPYELQAVNGVAAGRAGIGRDIANVYGQDALSRFGLEQGVVQGQAGANAAQAQNATSLGNSLAGIYSNDSSNRVGVYNGVTSGNMAANNLQAQGESQGARNLLGAGMGLASMAMGGMGGGSFGFGGGSGGFFSNMGGSSMFGNGTGYGVNPWSNNGMYAAGPAGASAGFFGTGPR